MRLLLRSWAIFTVSIHRLLAHRWLALATVSGLVMSIALALSIPLYADAVYYRVLREDLWGEPDVGQTDLPLTFLFRYIGGWEKSLQWEDVQPADTFMSGPGLATLRLPTQYYVRHFRTDKLGLFTADNTQYKGGRIDPLAWVSLAFTSGLEEHITITEGIFPVVVVSINSPVEVLVSEVLAEELGLQVGESFIAFGQRQKADDTSYNVEIAVRVAGVWHATDVEDPYWFSNPTKLNEVLLLPEESFTGRIAGYLEDEIYIALWHLVMDGSEVHTGDVGYLVGRIQTLHQRIASVLPDTRMDDSPMDALREYWLASKLLTVLLYAFSIPILGLILAFISLVVGLSVERQRNEIAVLRSRGATRLQVLGIAGLEALILGALALLSGLPVSESIAHLIGKTRSFLDFTLESTLRVEVTSTALYLGIAAVGLTLLAQIVPTFSAARHTIVTYKRDRARAMRAPWWQRIWLDGLLFIPAAYGSFLLRQQGSVAIPGIAIANNALNDPFQNPLLFLVPALGVFALTLFILRILPILMRIVTWIAAKLGSVGLLMASRHLARTPGFYAAPLILLILTLSLSAYVASLAQTLDHHLYDQRYYQVGADMRIVEQGETAGNENLSMIGMEDRSASTEDGPRWLFLPVSEHLRVPGVQGATRVGQYIASTSQGGRLQTATFLGVDRVNFAQVAFWRKDFAPTSLGALMNALAADRNGVLVPRSFLEQYFFSEGDTLNITVDIYDQRVDMELKIVGIFDLFPTWYPDDESQGSLFVGNLEYLFEQAGGQYPYDVWLATEPDVDYVKIEENVRDLRLYVQYWEAPLIEIFDEQQRPERQGLFGVLSVGFIAAALLTVMGFLLYAFFSFRQRFIELGVLRAIGLSVGQMTTFLAWELAFLILIGLSAGTGLGAWVSKLYIPYLQVGTDAAAQIPPYVVELSWFAIFRIYALFGALFFTALGVLVLLLIRIKIFQAIKLGESA